MATVVKEGDIITIRDFVDTLVYYLEPAVPNYSNKVTIVFDDGTRIIVLKNQRVGYFYNREHAVGRGGNYTDGYETNQKDLVVGAHLMPMRMGKNYHGPAGDTNTCNRAPLSREYVVTKVIDPADNTMYEGVDNHVFESKIPVAGELISIEDVKNLMVNTGSTIYKYTTVFVYEWYNMAFENNQDRAPIWDDPGVAAATSPGNGWVIDHTWQFRLLTAPETSTSEGLYAAINPSIKLKEDELISILQLQNIMNTMYSVNNNNGVDYIHHLTCHNNCHSSCHTMHW